MSTVDSSELIANCSLAPSYSEAGLYETFNCPENINVQAALEKEAEAKRDQRTELANSNNNCNSNSNCSSIVDVNGCSESEHDNRREIRPSNHRVSTLRSSISATVLSNGQLGYTVAALPGSGHQLSDCPPGYFDAIINCRPLFSNTYLSLSRLKRSFTERDFIEKTSKRKSSSMAFFASLREIREERDPVAL